MNVDETAIVFDCAGETLIGVLASSGAAASTGIVVVVGGPQYRAGSHRHFVQLARSLASAGYPTLRFDYRGMGDSTGEQRSFEAIDDDVRAAIDALQRSSPGVRQVVLWGLCDGATAALLYVQATADTRVRGLCLLNPWVSSAASQARTQIRHYYPQRLRHGEFWRKLLSGQVGSGALGKLWHSVATALGSEGPAMSYQQRMASALTSFAGPVLLLLSESDYTAKEFLEFARADVDWATALERAVLERHVLQDADHTLSDADAKLNAQSIIQGWLNRQLGHL